MFKRKKKEDKKQEKKQEVKPIKELKHNGNDVIQVRYEKHDAHFNGNSNQTTVNYDTKIKQTIVPKEKKDIYTAILTVTGNQDEIQILNNTAKEFDDKGIHNEYTKLPGNKLNMRGYLALILNELSKIKTRLDSMESFDIIARRYREINKID